MSRLRQQRLGMLIVASLGVHFLALSWWQKPALLPFSPTPAAFTAQLAPTAAVAREPLDETRTPEPARAGAREASEPAAAPQETPAPPATGADAPEPTVPAPVEPEGPSVATTETVLPTAIDQPPAAAPGADPMSARPAKPPLAAVAQAVRARLNERLNRDLHYPPLARKRGWQGTVRLRVSLDPLGRINAIHIADGSGYSVLDQAALRELREIHAIEPVLLHGYTITTDIHVDYRLRG